MQTFLPYTDFKLVASCLDNKRLNKQITEAKQILDIVEGKKNNIWANHTAARMWIDHFSSLREYINIMVDEWKNRKYISHSYVKSYPYSTVPEWLNSPIVIQSHRNSLLNKNFKHYSQFNWNYIKNAPSRCFWPVEPKTKMVKESNQKWLELYESIRWKI